MKKLKRFAIILALVIAEAIFAQGISEDDQVKSDLERINRRYDDFFRVHDEQQIREQRLAIGRSERKAELQRHESELEIARREYVKIRRPRIQSESLENGWLQEQKNKAQQKELFRRRYVERRDIEDQYLRKGRMVPPLKEFDLQDY